MNSPHVPCTRPDRIERSLASRIPRWLCTAMLACGLWSATVSAQEQEMLQLAIESGRMAHALTVSADQRYGELREQRDAMSRLMDALKVPATPGEDAQSRVAQLQRVRWIWQKIATKADRLIEKERIVLDAFDDAATVTSTLPVIASKLDELNRELAEQDVGGNLIRIVGRQQLLIVSMQRSCDGVLAGDEGAAKAADGLRQRLVLAKRIQKALSAGDAESGIDRLEEESSRTLAAEVVPLLDRVEAPVDRLGNAAATLVEAREESADLRKDLEEFQQGLLKLQTTLH